jgi:hypothetical protein
MNETVYVALLNEGVDVWRPVVAESVGFQTYRILGSEDYDPALEAWEFTPGTVVVCENRKTTDGIILAAVRKASGLLKKNR